MDMVIHNRRVYLHSHARVVVFVHFSYTGRCFRTLIGLFIHKFMFSYTDKRFYIQIHTIHEHCRKIRNLFVQALETGRKASICRAFLSCFDASLYFPTMYVYLVYIGKECMQKLLNLHTKKPKHQQQSPHFTRVFCALLS